MKSQPFKPPLLDEDVNRKRALFNNANATELPPLYYEASSFDKIAAMYSDVITKQQPPVVEEDKPVKGAKGNKGGKGALLFAKLLWADHRKLEMLWNWLEIILVLWWLPRIIQSYLQDLQ